MKTSYIATEFRPVHDAFGDAIKVKALSFNPQDPNWFCLYKYLGIVTGSDGVERDQFQNVTTRQYVEC